MSIDSFRILCGVLVASMLAVSPQVAWAQIEACCLPNGTCQSIAVADCLAAAGEPQGVSSCVDAACRPHIVAGVCGGEPTQPDALCPDGDVNSLKLFSAGGTQGISLDGPGIFEGDVVGVRRIDPGNNTGADTFKAPEFGGFSFGTRSLADIGTDYAITPYFPSLSKLPVPVSSFEIYTRRLSYSDPAEFAYYSVFGQPLMTFDGDTAFFGDEGDAHFHPFWLMRRPGLVSWTFQFTSNVDFEDSDPVTHFWTTVPGRGAYVPFDMTSVFNADLVDSDLSDTPVSFDGAGHSWLLNGLYGTSAGLPVDGALNEFQLGGADGSLLSGSNANALFDDGSSSSMATIDLISNGQEDQYLSVEFLIAGSGNFTSGDSLNVTLEYADGTMQAVQFKRHPFTFWLDYLMLADWQQSSSPLPVLAVGPNGDASVGFARSDGSAVDVSAGQQSYLFRATTVAFGQKTLNAVHVDDYTGSGRIAIFGALGIKKAPLEIVTQALPDATEGEPYSVFLDAEGTPPFKQWAASGLPAGLTLDPGTGEISGTPDLGSSSNSPYSVNFSVEDSINDFDSSFPPETAMTTISLSVVPGMIPGDINGDGLVNDLDIGLFIGVLVGTETNPDYVMRSDINGVDGANGADIQPFLATLGL